MLLRGFHLVVGGVLCADVVNRPTPPELASALAAEVVAARLRVEDRSLAEVPSSPPGAAPSARSASNRRSTDRPLRRSSDGSPRAMTCLRSTPSSTSATFVSLRYALPVAVFDQRDVVPAGSRCGFADGSEAWADLGASTAPRPEPGECDLCRRCRSGQRATVVLAAIEASAARDDTTRVLVTVEGHHDAARDNVTAALQDLETLLGRFAAARVEQQAILDRDRPAL